MRSSVAFPVGPVPAPTDLSINTPARWINSRCGSRELRVGESYTRFSARALWPALQLLAPLPSPHFSLAMNSALVTIRISSGPVIGFKDTHPLGDASSAPRVVAGQDGGLLPVRKWLGIPYAKADRWCRPNSVAPWVEPLPTLEFGCVRACVLPGSPTSFVPQLTLRALHSTMFPQGPSPVLPLYSDHPGSLPRSFVGQSEHSHFLNVFASPGVDERASVPVLVSLKKST